MILLMIRIFTILFLTIHSCTSIGTSKHCTTTYRGGCYQQNMVRCLGFFFVVVENVSFSDFVSGGEAGPIQNMIDIFETKVISCREKLIRWEGYGVDESLRVDKSRSLAEIEKRNIYNV